MYRLAICCLLLAAPSWLSAQGFLDKLIDKTSDKVSESVTEEASDKAAEESGEAVDKWLDGMFGGDEDEAAPTGDQSTQKGTPGGSEAAHSSGSNMDEEQINAMMEQMMGGMDKSAAVPAEYRFDVVLDITVQDGKDDPVYLSLLLQESGEAFGMRTDDGDGGTQTSVIDGPNGVMAIFQDQASGERTGMGMPNMMEAAAQMGAAQSGAVQTEAEANWSEYSFEATGKTKKVAGYTCKEYRAVGPDGEAWMYASDALEVDWMKSMASGFGEQMPAAFSNAYPAGMKGSMLESRSIDKKTGKVSTWVTTAVHKDGTTIRKADYTFGMGAMK